MRGKTRRQTNVAFVFNNHDRAGFGDAEVDAADSHVSRCESIAQRRTRGAGQLRDVVGRRHPERLCEQFRDLSFCFVNRGRDDVRRRLVRKLNDVFAEIRFDHLHARSFQRIVEMRLFGRHALAFDDRARVAFERKLQMMAFASAASPAQWTTAPRFSAFATNVSR